MGLYSQQQIPTQLRDISEYVLYYKPLANQGDTNLIYFYSIHLKAGSSQTNEELRRQEAETFKQFLINNNRNNNLFVGGDFNFYDYLEPACQEILFGQSLDLVDPINQMEIGIIIVHTQIFTLRVLDLLLVVLLEELTEEWMIGLILYLPQMMLSVAVQEFNIYQVLMLQMVKMVIILIKL